MLSNKELLKQFNERKGISKSGLKSQYRHIQECRAFYSGDYMDYRDEFQYGRGQSRSLKEVSFNRVKPYVNSIVGFMLQNRRKPDYQARLQDMREQQMYTTYLNGLSEYVRENMNADQTETRQDMDLIIGGIGATETAITLKDGTPTRTPTGEIVKERVDVLEIGWDPQCDKPNLLDSRWVFRAKNYDVEEAIALLDADEDDFEYTDSSADDVSNMEFNPYGGIQDKIGFEWGDAKRTMVKLYFYHWYEVEPFYRIENPVLTIEDPDLAQSLYDTLGIATDGGDEESIFKFDPDAEMLVITKDKKTQVRDIFKAYGLKFNPSNEKRKVYYTALISGEKVFQKFKSVDQQGYSIQFKTGDRDETNHIWTGIVASLRDPQRYYNRSLTELMLIIASNSRGGVIYEEGAIPDVQEFEALYARSDSAVSVANGALSGNRVQPKATPKLQNGYEEINALSDRAMSQVTGLNESFFGAISGGNETAILQRQRVKQAQVTLASYFDSAALYAKEQARMMQSYIRLLAENNNGKLFPMSDGQGNLVMERLSPDFFADEYDVVVTEAPETAVQKEAYSQILINIAQGMQAVGDPSYKQIYIEAIQQMPISDAQKAEAKRILETPQVNPQVVQQMQQQLQQLQGEQQQLLNARMQAEIQNRNMDTAKKQSDIQMSQFDARKAIEDIEGKAIENDLLALKSPSEVNATI